MLSVESVSICHRVRVKQLHIVVGIDDIQKCISVATLRCCKHDDFIQRRDFLQKVLQIRPEKGVYCHRFVVVCDLELKEGQKTTSNVVSYTSMGSITQ